MHVKSYEYGQIGINLEGNYYFKTPSPNRRMDIVFHDSPDTMDRAVYTRTAYRNDPVMDVGAIRKLPPALKERRFKSMIENDAAATGNFQRLASNALARAFQKGGSRQESGLVSRRDLGRNSKSNAAVISRSTPQQPGESTG